MASSYAVEATQRRMNDPENNSQPVCRHILPGRVRMEVPGVKGSAQRAAELTQFYQNLPGIIGVKADPLTGSVLVRFNPEVLGPEQMVDALRRQDYLHSAVERQQVREVPASCPAHADAGYVQARSMPALGRNTITVSTASPSGIRPSHSKVPWWVHPLTEIVLEVAVKELLAALI